jgi:hypothetical protein
MMDPAIIRAFIALFALLTLASVIVCMAVSMISEAWERKRRAKEDKDFWAHWWKSWEPFYAELAHEREMERLQAERPLKCENCGHAFKCEEGAREYH